MDKRRFPSRSLCFNSDIRRHNMKDHYRISSINRTQWWRSWGRTGWYQATADSQAAPSRQTYAHGTFGTRGWQCPIYQWTGPEVPWLWYCRPYLHDNAWMEEVSQKHTTYSDSRETPRVVWWASHRQTSSVPGMMRYNTVLLFKFYMIRLLCHCTISIIF